MKLGVYKTELSKINKLYSLCIGIILYHTKSIFKIKKNRWCFGSFHNMDYRDNSKYLFQYSSTQNEIECVWITRNRELIKELRRKGLKAYHNLSIRGIYNVMTCSKVIACHDFGADINFFYKNDNRTIVYLMHGMAIKKIMLDRPAKYFKKEGLMGKLYLKYVAAFQEADCDFICASSDFFSNFLGSAFGGIEKIKVTGLPRNDLFFNSNLLKEVDNFYNVIPEANGKKFIITYMPTHRGFGKGDISPLIFRDDPMMMDWLKKNNILLIIKNHPWMAKKVITDKDTDNYIEITLRNIDPQIVEAHSDILITDYSTCWIDYILQRKPVIFYFYDNYMEDDNDVYFNIEKECTHFAQKAHNEKDLKKTILNICSDYESHKPPIETIKKYHKYIDSHSSKRIFDYLSKC